LIDRVKIVYTIGVYQLKSIKLYQATVLCWHWHL